MPEPFLREMLADWMGACRAYEGFYPESQGKWEWLNNNWNKIQLNKESRVHMQLILDEVLPK